MKILVFSDTHGKINSAINIIESHKNIDLIIHLGDLVRDAQDIEAIADTRVEYVAGNNDFYTNVPTEKIIEVGGKKLLLAHGHTYRVKHSLQLLMEEGQNNSVDAVLFGHTHKSHEEHIYNILYFNPGSLTYPEGYPSYGLIEIIDDKICSMICQKK